MKIDPDNAATLSAIVDSDIAAIERLDARLRDIYNGCAEIEFRDSAALAYILHNLYNAFENSFEHISREFENNVRDVSQWHKELLGKMLLDIPGIRPAVLPQQCRKLLNELRGFRHVFRHSYDFEIDADRLKPLVEHWMAGCSAPVAALKEFSALLREVSLLDNQPPK